MIRMIARTFGWVARVFLFWLVPLVLIMAIGWSGVQVVDAIGRQWRERDSYVLYGANFSGTATQIVLNQPTNTYTPTLTSTPSSTPSPTPTYTDTPTTTVTPTSSPTLMSTYTETPSLTYTYTPAPTKTEEPSQTPSSSQSAQTMLSAQLFVTNTPRPIVFATITPSPTTELSLERSTSSPTPLLSLATATLRATPIVFISPTQTPSASPTNESMQLPQIIATNPLPTPLFPREVEAGLVMGGTLVPTIVPLVQRDYNLVNIILLGGDSELTTDGTIRTDTMIVVSINRDTNTVNMLSFPRDLYVFIPTPTGMMNRLNVVYGLGEAIGYTGGGFGLLRQTFFYNFGINIHYYAKVDFSGFKAIIDAIGGISVAVDCTYQDYALIGADLPTGAVRLNDDGLYQLGVGYYEMTGAQALWFARTRHNSSDFDRGRRQQQVLRAIWRKALRSVNFNNVGQLWEQGMSILETDLRFEDFVGLLPIGLNLDVSQIRNFTFIPTYHTTSWTAPDGANVQIPIAETVAQLMNDFYRPPSSNQLLLRGASIAVYNGTPNPLWDRVATDRLIWEGFNAVAMGEADTTNHVDTILIDYTGQQKGGSAREIARILNVRPENIISQPNPDRTSDFDVILGANYNSCQGGVVDISNN